MLLMVLNMPAGKVFQLVGYTSWQIFIHMLAGRMIDPTCLAGSKFAYQIGNMIRGEHLHFYTKENERKHRTVELWNKFNANTEAYFFLSIDMLWCC